eukprot:588934_1
MTSLFDASRAMMVASRRPTRNIAEEDDEKGNSITDKTLQSEACDSKTNDNMDLERLSNSTFNLMFNEITEKQEREDALKRVKNQWIIGSEVEVYSFSQKGWVRAEIVRIFSDKEGEWLAVKYLNNKIKEIQRYNKYIRPIAHGSEDHEIEAQATMDYDEDSLSEAHRSMFDLKRNQNFVIQDEDMEDAVNWDEILSAISTGNIQLIKTLITSNSIDINAQHPGTGKTLLIYSVIIGNYDLVAVLCNFGSNVYVKDNDGSDALHYAIKYGQYRITELLYYRQLSGAFGKDLKDIATKLYQKKRESKLLKAFKHEDAWDEDNQLLHHLITKFIIKAIQNREVFGKDMLFYAWHFVTNDEKTKNNPLESDLFKTMMTTYTEILCNTEDKAGWKWLRKYFVDSLIWYLPHPKSTTQKHQEDEEDDMDDNDDLEFILQNTLFYELLVRVRKESKRQSDLLLKRKIWNIKQEKAKHWKQLTEYNVVTEHSANARQDLCGCIQPKYTEDDLNEDLYPPSIHFNAKEHYDKNIYLNELMFRANVLDATFQKDIRKLSKQICNETNGKINARYRAGPVKTLKRSLLKVDNDYIQAMYPTSAKIVDINRCALQFTDIETMMKFIVIFEKKIKNQNAHSIKKIIRCKNGWSVYNQYHPQYTDIKLNVLIQSPYDEQQMIVGEVQFLLDLMSKFKRIAHRLYGVERLYEMVYNYNKLVSHVQSFKDNHGTNATLIDLAKHDDIYYFKLFWNTIQTTPHTLIGSQKPSKNVWDTSLFHIIYKNGNINTYLKNEYSDLYRTTIAKYIKTYVAKYGFISTSSSEDELGFLDSISSNCNAIDNKDMMVTRCMKQLFGSFEHNPKQWRKMITIEDKDKRNIIHAICRSEIRYKQAIKQVLNTSLMSYKQIFKICTMRQWNKRPFDNQFLDVAMELLRYVQNDKLLLMKLLKGPGAPFHAICKSQDRLSNRALWLILKNPLISDRDFLDLFHCRNKDRQTALYFAVNEGYYRNVQFILHHFGDNKPHIKNWLRSAKQDVLFGADDECMVQILRYFKNDRRMLFKLLTHQKKESGWSRKCYTRVFDEICREKRIKSLKCILHECPTINHKDVLNLLCDTKYLQDKSPMFDSSDGIFPTGLEIIKYFKNDRIPFFKLLSCAVSDDMNIFMAICESVDEDNVEQNLTALRLIFEESALTEYDIYQLMLFKNKEYKTALFYALESWFKNIVHVFFDAIPPKYLVKLLRQKTEKEDKICAMVCGKKQHILRVLDAVIAADDTVLGKKLISKKDDLDSDVKEAVETYQVYCDMKEMHTMIIQKCKHFVKMVEEKSKDVAEEKREEFKQLISAQIANLKKHGDKLHRVLFTGGCFLGQHQAVQDIAAIRDDEVRDEMLMLIQLELQSDIMKSVLCRPEKNTTILQLFFDYAKRSDAIDECMRTALPSAVFEAQHHHLIYIMEQFKDDSNLLYKLMSQTNKDKKQLFDCICESKKDDKHRTVRTLLKHMKARHVFKLLRYRFKIKDYDPDDNRVYYNEMSFRNALIHGLGGDIIEWARYDRKLLLKLLRIINDEAIEANAKNCDFTPLMLICTGYFEDRDESKFKDNETIKTILNDSALNHRDKMEVISCKFEHDNGTVLHTACQFGKTSINAVEIVNYFATDVPMLIKLLSMKTKSDGDTCLIKAVKHGKLRFIQAVFRSINDNAVMLRLLSMQNKKFETAFDVARQMTTEWHSRRWRRNHNDAFKYEIEELIEACFDYLKFDQLLDSNRVGASLNMSSFEEYATNPWMTCCQFGKRKTIRKVLDCIHSIDCDQNNNEQLKELLVKNCDIETGNNGLMIALQNGSNDIVSEIFADVANVELKVQLLSTKNLKGENMITLLCKDDNNLDFVLKLLDNMNTLNCDKQTLYTLVTDACRGHKSCLESVIYEAVCTKYNNSQYL